MKEALKLALEALLDLKDDCSGCEFEWSNDYPLQAKALQAIKEALAQPEQEPDKYLMDIECTKCGAKQSGVLTVNTTPPQRTWVGLTDEEIYMNCPNWLSQEQCKVWIQQIEAKLKEKNT